MGGRVLPCRLFHPDRPMLNSFSGDVMQFSRFTLPLLAASLLMGAVLVAVPAAAKKPIFTLTDPRGDDHGDGNYIYPGNRQLEPGQLDILTFEAFDEGNGTRFEVTFAKPVKKPERQAIDDLG